jgi:hypothetical protein
MFKGLIHKFIVGLGGGAGDYGEQEEIINYVAAAAEEEDTDGEALLDLLSGFFPELAEMPDAEARLQLLLDQARKSPKAPAPKPQTKKNSPASPARQTAGRPKAVARQRGARRGGNRSEVDSVKQDKEPPDVPSVSASVSPSAAPATVVGRPVKLTLDNTVDPFAALKEKKAELDVGACESATSGKERRKVAKNARRAKNKKEDADAVDSTDADEDVDPHALLEKLVQDGQAEVNGLDDYSSAWEACKGAHTSPLLSHLLSPPLAPLLPSSRTSSRTFSHTTSVC